MLDMTFLFFMLQLGTAQFLAYVIRTAGAQARHGQEYDKGCPELYASLQLCFQVRINRGGHHPYYWGVTIKGIFSDVKAKSFSLKFTF